MPRTRRTVLPLASPPIVEIENYTIDSGACTTAGSLDFAHTWFLPLHYEPSYAYPLLIWLHAAGEDERQLIRLMPSISLRNYLAVAPRGLSLSETLDDGSRERFGWLQTDEHIQQAEGRVLDCIELARRQYHIRPRRAFVAGFDAGGTMALRIAMNHPDRFGGAISLCGPFPAGRSPLGNLLAARRLGLLLAHGRGSREYPARRACDDLRLLHSAGLSITLRQYPCGHELSLQMLADVDRWLIEQITRTKGFTDRWPASPS